MAFEYSMRARVAPDVLFREVADESVILNLKTELYMGLDAVSTRTWMLLSEARSIQSVYDSLLAEYEVDERKLRRDLDDFLDQLLAQELIEIVPGEVAASTVPE